METDAGRPSPGPGGSRPFLTGTETEYGIAAPGRPDLDAATLAALVVDAWTGPATPPVSDTHNRTLGNGGRLYVDHGHPEYATPEVTSASDLVRWSAAGDLLVAEAAAAASERIGSPIRIHRNNTDGKGAAYGHHENVLLRRSTPWSTIEAALPAVLVTRVVLAGAGRVGLGPASERPGFQLSQRADFFERVSGLDTTRHRGIVNTRDEPLARRDRWRRLHVITGDALRSPFGTWLAAGTLGLCLAALEDGLLPVISLRDPVGAFRAVSRDVGVGVRLERTDGPADTALGLQERFRDAAAALVGRSGFPESAELLEAWSATLDALRRGPDAVADRLDWAAKLALLEGFRARDGLGWEDARLAALDLAWSDLAPGGVVDRLRAAGRFPAGPDAAGVRSATGVPPPDTRAATRGIWITHHPDAVLAATWESLLVRDSRGALHTLDLADPFHPGPVPAGPPGSGEATAVDTLIRAHGARTGGGGRR